MTDHNGGVLEERLTRRTFVRRSVNAGVGLSLLGSLPALAACGGGDGGAAEGPIKVGLLISFKGPGALFGPPTENAARLAVEELNADGGVLGRELELVVGDDQTDPKVGADVMNRLVNQDKVDLVIGMHSSATRVAVAPIPERANKLYLYTPVYEGTDCGSNAYYLGEVPNQQLAPSIPWMMEDTGEDSWYMIGSDYVWPRTEIPFAEKVVQEAGGSVAGVEYVPLGTSEFSASIAKVQRSNARLVLVVVPGGDAVAFVKQAHDFGLTKNVRLLTTIMEENTIAGIGGPAARGLRTALSYFQNLVSDANRDFLQRYRKQFGNDAPPQTSLSEGVYEAVHLVAQGAEEAGSLEVEDVVEAMAGQSFDGPAGRVELNAENRHLKQHIYIAEADGNAEFRIVTDLGEIEPEVDCGT